MKVENCAYCMEGVLLEKFGIKICDLSVSTLILFKEQSHPGRVIVASNTHVDEISDLSKEERAAFMEDVSHAAQAVHKAFHPQKINYGAYGDTMHHLHFHLVPKYTDEFEWGGVFAMNPEKTFLTDEEYEIMIDKVKSNL